MEQPQSFDEQVCEILTSRGAKAWGPIGWRWWDGDDKRWACTWTKKREAERRRARACLGRKAGGLQGPLVAVYPDPLDPGVYHDLLDGCVEAGLGEPAVVKRSVSGDYLATLCNASEFGVQNFGTTRPEAVCRAILAAGKIEGEYEPEPVAEPGKTTLEQAREALEFPNPEREPMRAFRSFNRALLFVLDHLEEQAAMRVCGICRGCGYVYVAGSQEECYACRGVGRVKPA